jgi:hypothetical protein
MRRCDVGTPLPRNAGAGTKTKPLSLAPVGPVDVSGLRPGRLAPHFAKPVGRSPLVGALPPCVRLPAASGLSAFLGVTLRTRTYAAIMRSSDFAGAQVREFVQQPMRESVASVPWGHGPTAPPYRQRTGIPRTRPASGKWRLDRRPRSRLLSRLFARPSDCLDMTNIGPTAPTQHVDAGEPFPELGMLATKFVRVSIVELSRFIEFGMAHS